MEDDKLGALEAVGLGPIGQMLAHIEAAKSIADLEALVPEIRQLSEEDRAKLRIPWRAARELLERLARAPVVSPLGKSTFRL